MLPQVPDAAHRGATALRLLLKGTYRMYQPKDVSGTAALGICESLLLALNDKGILPEKDIVMS
tara:strand:+ start:475 stop:663 length:189 start_codon:yes stop_codon:yes gene_type:complete